MLMYNGLAVLANHYLQNQCPITKYKYSGANDNLCDSTGTTKAKLEACNPQSEGGGWLLTLDTRLRESVQIHYDRSAIEC